MSFEISVYAAGNFAIFRGAGVLSSFEYLDTYRAYIADPRYVAGGLQLLDLRDTTEFIGDFKTIQRLVKVQNTEGGGDKAGTRTAILVSTEYMFGIARMFHQCAEILGGEIYSVHTSEAEAFHALSLPFESTKAMMKDIVLERFSVSESRKEK